MDGRTIGRHNRAMQAHRSADPSCPVLPDVLRAGLAIVFCGTAPGTASAQAGAYYAKPGNRFWRVLHEVGLTPVQLRPADYLRLLDYNIGLTDLCKTAFGQDSDLPHDALDREGLCAKILNYQPQVLAFTSLQGARWYFCNNRVRPGLQIETIGTTRIVALPSTSGLATKHWSIAPWQALAAMVRV
jgi:double-stranded uracil-DNA glycosylase